MATPTRLNSYFASTSTLSSTNTISGISVSAGNGMALTIHLYNEAITISSVTQTNCTWTQAVRESSTLAAAVEVWYCLSAGASPGTSIVITYSASTLPSSAIVGVYDTPFVALDKTAVATNNGSPAATTGTTATTTFPIELWVGGNSIKDPTNTGFAFGAASNGFSIVQEFDSAALNSTAVHCTYLDKIVSTTGTAGTSGTGAVVSNTGAIATLQFLVPAGGGNLLMMGMG